VTKREINKHVKETKELIKGVYGQTRYKGYYIFFHLRWLVNEEVSISTVRASEHNRYLELLLTYDPDNTQYWFDENIDEIHNAIRKTKVFKDFERRIKNECKWANLLDDHISWHDAVLDVAEHEIKKESESK
jgi:hypothetical protein